MLFVQFTHRHHTASDIRRCTSRFEQRTRRPKAVHSVHGGCKLKPWSDAAMERERQQIGDDKIYMFY